MYLPLVRKTGIEQIIPTVSVVLLLSLAIYFLRLTTDYSIIVFISCLILTAYKLVVRYTITNNLIKGLRLTKDREFKEAIGLFEQVYDYFDKHPFLDKYRSLILLSTSSYSYKELALLNIAFCYTQLGDKTNATKYYNECLKLNPNNGPAKTSLTQLKRKKINKPKPEI